MLTTVYHDIVCHYIFVISASQCDTNVSEYNDFKHDIVRPCQSVDVTGDFIGSTSVGVWVHPGCAKYRQNMKHSMFNDSRKTIW